MPALGMPSSQNFHGFTNWKLSLTCHSEFFMDFIIWAWLTKATVTSDCTQSPACSSPPTYVMRLIVLLS